MAVEPFRGLVEDVLCGVGEFGEVGVPVLVADGVVAHLGQQLRNAGVVDELRPSLAGLLAAGRDDGGEVVDHRVDTAFVQLKVVAELVVDLRKQPGSVGPASYRRPDVLPPSLNDVKPQLLGHPAGVELETATDQDRDDR